MIIADGPLDIRPVSFTTPPSNSNLYCTSQRKKELVKYLTQDVLHNMENVKDNKGMTELHHAAKNGKENEVELMLYFVQDRSPKDDLGMTPMHYSAENGHLKIVEMYLNHAMVLDKNPKSNSGMTPIHMGSKNGHLDVVGHSVVGWALPSKLAFD